MTSMNPSARAARRIAAAALCALLEAVRDALPDAPSAPPAAVSPSAQTVPVTARLDPVALKAAVGDMLATLGLRGAWSLRNGEDYDRALDGAQVLYVALLGSGADGPASMAANAFFDFAARLPGLTCVEWGPRRYAFPGSGANRSALHFCERFVAERAT